MYLLATEKKNSVIWRWCTVYFLISVFCLFFGVVYERYSHQVYSACMQYAFFIPLIGGSAVCIILGKFCTKTMPGRISFNLYNSGIAALTVGCIVQGILEIYGTTNRLVAIYWIFGGCFLIAALLTYSIGVKIIYTNG